MIWGHVKFIHEGLSTSRTHTKVHFHSDAQAPWRRHTVCRYGFNQVQGCILTPWPGYTLARKLADLIGQL